MLAQFKNFQADRMDIDELVALAAYGRSLRDEYEKHNLDEPEFVDAQLKSLRREISARNADKLESRRKEINARLETLKTPTQRKSELLKERAEIDKQLATV
jgi:phosphoenolpyruvate synthase/pyruvate phosphate dikinase